MLKRMWKGSIAALITLGVLGCGPSYDGLVQYVERQQGQFSPLISALQEHHARFGVYPAAISDLSSAELPLLYAPPDTKLDGPKYEVSRDRSFFRMYYGLDDLTTSDSHPYATYSSLNDRWVVIPNISGFAHVEAKHYGALFARDGSAESLKFTVASLLDAAAPNSKRPCRNFWKKWLSDALGEGSPASHDLPGLTPQADARIYSSADRTLSYMFIVEDRMFPPIEKQLPIVTKVYRTTSNVPKQHWQLVNGCDSSS